MEDLVSIIVPAYNEEKYLNRCLDSLVEQTYKNIEVLVVDDGSVDNTFEIAKEYENKDKRFKVYKKQNGGLSSARNYALERMNGNYIYYLDSDDYLYPTSIEYLLGILINSNVDIVYSFTNRRNAYPMVLDSDIVFKNREEAIFSYLKGENFSESCCAKLFKKAIFNDLRFEEGRIHEDTFITYQILERINKIAITKFNGYISEIREDSITHQRFGNKNYDKVIASHNIYDFYKNSQFEKLAYNKYVGCLLYFVLKTNKLNSVTKNKEAINEFKGLIKTNGMKNLNLKFYPFVVLLKCNIIGKISI